MNVAADVVSRLEEPRTAHTLAAQVSAARRVPLVRDSAYFRSLLCYKWTDTGGGEMPFSVAAQHPPSHQQYKCLALCPDLLSTLLAVVFSRSRLCPTYAELVPRA